MKDCHADRRRSRLRCGQHGKMSARPLRERADFLGSRNNSGLREQVIDAHLQARGMRTNQATNGLSVGEEDQGGYTLDAYLRGRLQVLVRIHAGEAYLTGVGQA